MHEVRITAPVQASDRLVGLALEAGISKATVYDVFVHGPNERQHVISVEISTPQAKAFLDALFGADWLETKQYSITTRELRAIFSAELISDLTRPMIEPALDVLEDLWPLNHITPSYIGRATALRRIAKRGFRSALAVSDFRLCARLGFSIPSAFSGQRRIIAAFGYSAPHLSAGGT